MNVFHISIAKFGKWSELCATQSVRAEIKDVNKSDTSERKNKGYDNMQTC